MRSPRGRAAVPCPGCGEEWPVPGPRFCGACGAALRRDGASVGHADGDDRRAGVPAGAIRAGVALAALVAVGLVVRGVLAARQPPVELEPAAALTEAVDEEALAPPPPAGCGTVHGCYEGCAAPFALDRPVLWCRGHAGTPAPPAITGSTVVTLRDREVVAVDRTTGTQRWRTSVPSTGGAIPSVTDPLSDGRVLALVPDVRGDVLVAYDLADGEPVWTGPPGTGGAATAVGDTVLVAGQDGHLTALDATTGELRWERPASQSPYRAPATLLELAYLATPDGVVGLDVADGTVVLEVPVVAPSYQGPFVSPAAVGVTVTPDGRVTAFDAVTGGPGWSVALDHPVGVAPTLSEDRVFLVTSDDVLIALDLVTGRVLAQVPVAAAVGGQRALSVTRDRVVLTTLTQVRLLDPDTLATREVLDLGRAIVGSPVVTGETMFLTTQSALYAIESG